MSQVKRMIYHNKKWNESVLKKVRKIPELSATEKCLQTEVKEKVPHKIFCRIAINKIPKFQNENNMLKKNIRKRMHTSHSVCPGRWG